MGKIVIDGQKMTLQNSSRRCYSSMCDLTWRTCWVVCRSLGWSFVSTVALLVLSWCCCTMPKRSPAKRDFRDNGERKIKKSKEGASSSTSNVDEDLVRSFFCFLLWHKLIWFLVQHNLTSLDFLEWKKRLIHVEANIFIILLRGSSLKREHVLSSMIEGKLPRHMTWSASASNLSISGFTSVYEPVNFFFVSNLLFFYVLLCWLLCFLCFTSLASLTGSYTEDEPISVDVLFFKTMSAFLT